MNTDTLNTRMYDEFEQGTLRLHELIRAGQEASAEAERLRDWLYGPWKQMTAEQRDFGNGLSTDLYMLNPDDGEVFEDASEEERSPQRLGLAIKSAWDHHDWATALSLLRRGPQFFPQSHIAYLRARAYEEFGRLKVALTFIRHARALDPNNPVYKVLEIHLLRALNRKTEAVELAERYLVQPDAPAKLVVYAAGVVFDNTKHLSDADAAPTWRRLAKDLTPTLGAAAMEDSQLAASGYVTLGACYEGLGELETSLQSYRAALMLLRSSSERAVSAALEAYIRERFRPQAVPPASIIQVNREARFTLASALTEAVGV